jgi:16S rRNA A1518/A1519 N6-dimethyltransferase RsmA/KsgA/DIM1 with predicted DNA glycosylase/AP lyase activity
MIQDEVWHKIKTDADKKSFLWRLLNYAYNINYCKTVWPKSINPAPRVKSCLVEFFQKEDIIDLSFSWLFEFLDLYSQFSRKTLWAINKILQKQWKKTFTIPEEISKKRLEELNWNNIKTMVS